MNIAKSRKALALIVTLVIAGTLLATAPTQAKSKKSIREAYIDAITQSVKKTRAYFSGNTLNYYARGSRHTGRVYGTQWLFLSLVSKKIRQSFRANGRSK